MHDKASIWVSPSLVWKLTGSLGPLSIPSWNPEQISRAKYLRFLSCSQSGFRHAFWSKNRHQKIKKSQLQVVGPLPCRSKLGGLACLVMLPGCASAPVRACGGGAKLRALILEPFLVPILGPLNSATIEGPQNWNQKRPQNWARFQAQFWDTARVRIDFFAGSHGRAGASKQPKRQGY